MHSALQRPVRGGTGIQGPCPAPVADPRAGCSSANQFVTPGQRPPWAPLTLAHLYGYGCPRTVQRPDEDSIAKAVGARPRLYIVIPAICCQTAQREGSAKRELLLSACKALRLHGRALLSNSVACHVRSERHKLHCTHEPVRCSLAAEGAASRKVQSSQSRGQERFGSRAQHAAVSLETYKQREWSKLLHPEQKVRATACACVLSSLRSPACSFLLVPCMAMHCHGDGNSIAKHKRSCRAKSGQPCSVGRCI